MIPIGCLIIYDFINLLLNLNEVIENVIEYYTTLDKYFYSLRPYLVEVILIASVVLFYNYIISN